MRISLGVDSRTPDANQPIVSLLQRLAFSQSEVDVLHVVPPVQFPGGELLPVLSAFAALSYEQLEWPDASTAVTAVAEQLKPHYTTRETIVTGTPATDFLRESERQGAELLALNASHTPAWEGGFVGSVARAAVVAASCSVLIARPPHVAARPLHAVLATDHSPYLDRCLSVLEASPPTGLAELTVLTASPLRAIREQLFATGKSAASAETDPEHELRSRNADVIARLDAAFGDSAPVMQSRVFDGPVHEAIAQTMEETSADLLILGAQGHRFFERLTLGSVSFRAALHGPYSVLILRAPQKS